MKLTTLCFFLDDGKVLLAMKKRDFGIGKWNGPGGKVQPEETIEQACRREVFEETGMRVIELEPRGTIEFVFEGKPEWDNSCSIFVTTNFEGVPQETEEMYPAWFTFDNLPFNEMWEDDRMWLPGVLNGGNVHTRFVFDASGKMLREEKL